MANATPRGCTAAARPTRRRVRDRCLRLSGRTRCEAQHSWALYISIRRQPAAHQAWTRVGGGGVHSLNLIGPPSFLRGCSRLCSVCRTGTGPARLQSPAGQAQTADTRARQDVRWRAAACAMPGYTRRCAIAPMNEVAALTRPNAKPTSGPTVHHDRSAAGSSDDRPRPAAPLRRVQCAVPPHPPLPCWRVRPDEATSERRSTVQRKTTPGSPRKRRPTARPERKRRRLGLSGNRLGFRSQWMDYRSARRSLRNGAWVCLHRCERRRAVRPATSTPQCATPPASDHSSG